DAAAEAPLPYRYDRIDALVAGSLDRLEKELAVEPVARRDPERSVGALRAAQERRAERRGRGDDGDRLGHGEPPRDHRALGVCLAMMAAPPESRAPGGRLERRAPPGAEGHGPA